jgi:hypothetical protein
MNIPNKINLYWGILQMLSADHSGRESRFLQTASIPTFELIRVQKSETFCRNTSIWAFRNSGSLLFKIVFIIEYGGWKGTKAR